MQLNNTIANIEKTNHNNIETIKILKFIAFKDYISGLSTEVTTEKKIVFQIDNLFQ